MALAAGCLLPAAAAHAAWTVEREWHDEEAARSVVAIFRTVEREYPRLFHADGFRRLLLRKSTPDEFRQDQIGYDSATKTVIVSDPKELTGGSSPGLFKPGLEAEATVFHEMLHAMAASLREPGAKVSRLELDYARDVSGGRQQSFVADMKKAKLELSGASSRRADAAIVLAPAGETVGDGSEPAEFRARIERRRAAAAARMSREEALRVQAEADAEALALLCENARLLGLGGDCSDPDRLHAAIQAARTGDPARYERASAEMRRWTDRNTAVGREQAQLERRKQELLALYRVPRRREGDSHAVEGVSEWFAYGGEFYVYAARPSDSLTKREMDFWAGLLPFLQGRAALPEGR